MKKCKKFLVGLKGTRIFAWSVDEIISDLTSVFIGEIKRKRPYMSLLRYYIGKLNLIPRWDSRVEDVLSAALSVYEIQKGKDSHERDSFYIVFSASNFRHVLDVMRVFRANGVVGRLCYTDVKNKDGKAEQMLALCVRDRGPKYFAKLQWKDPNSPDGNLLEFDLPIYVGGQKFIYDVQNTKANMDYYTLNVLQEYNTIHANKKYLFRELFGPFSR